MSSEAETKAAVKAALAKWKPFAAVAEFAFDDRGDIYVAGFIDGIEWARAHPAPKDGAR